MASKTWDQSPQEIANSLGWVEDVAHGGRCEGYYREPAFSPLLMPKIPLKQGPISIRANQTEFRQSGKSVLLGKVELNQPDRRLQADRVELKRNNETGKISSADLYGKVVLREPGRLLVSDYAHMFLDRQAGSLHHVLYRVLLADPARLNRLPQKINVSGQTGETDLNAWGKAAQVTQTKPGLIQLLQATYTTCTPLNNIWQLSSRSIHLDRDSGRGEARDVSLSIKNIPVFYSPYFNFPVDKRRKSGFLFPYITTSSTSGLQVGIPYYWNIAPNYDLTFTPRVLTKRGVRFDGSFRYLTSLDDGALNLSFLPNDRTFREFRDTAPSFYAPSAALTELSSASSNRAYFSWQNSTIFNEHWTSRIDYTYVSDDYYFIDFGSVPAVINANQLLRQGNVAYANEHWNFLAQVQNYQTLHPVNQVPIANQYSSFPRLALNATYPDQAFGLNYQLISEWVNFFRTRGPTDTVVPPIGNRLHLQPSVSLPMIKPEAYITPKIQFAATRYQLRNQTPGFSSEINRVLPLLGVEGGLYFDRALKILKNAYRQTLEPQISYLFVPYHNQNAIPIFDSALQPFSYDQLFRYNRFSGNDRIGDANQFSLALTTRISDKMTGEEKLKVSVGQIYYFQNRKVTLCNTPGCQDTLFVPGATSPTESVSPFAGQANYQLNAHWASSANLAWDPGTRRTINGNFNFQYHPSPNRLLNLGYNFIRFGDPLLAVVPPAATSSANNFSQPSISFAWPIKESWRAMGSYNYNLSHNHPQTYFYGLEYNSCCWAVRLVASRTFTALNQNFNPVFNNAIYFQWQLKGLGNIGTNDPSSVLTNGIPGYSDNFGKI